MPTLRERIENHRMNLCWKGFPGKVVTKSKNRLTKRFNTKDVELTLEWRTKWLPDGYSEEEMLKVMETFLNRQITCDELRSLQAMKDSKVKPITKREIMSALQRGTDAYWHEVDKAKPKPIDGTAIEFMAKAVLDLMGGRNGR